MADLYDKLSDVLRSLVSEAEARGPDHTRREMTFAATCAQLLRRLSDLTATPLVQGTVIRLLETDAGDQASIPGTGLEVQITGSRDYPQTVGQIGVVVNNLSDRDDQVMVIFDDGSYGFYRGRPLDGQAEVKVVNRQHHVLVGLDSRLIELATPPHLTLQVGDTVMLSQQTTQIVSRVESSSIGTLVPIERLLPGQRAEVSANGQRHVVVVREGLPTIEPGHRVLLDVSGRAVVENLGFDDGRFAPKQFKPVEWTQIGGYAQVKRELQELVGEMYHPAISATIDPEDQVHGILLHGPGGTGKSYLVKALYTAILKEFKAQQIDDSGFFNIEAAELLEGIVGETEKLMRRTVNRASDFADRTGLPAVILLNEIDAIAKKRGTGISTDVNDTNVPMLLGLMDGFERHNILWVFVTNRLDVLDPELIRDGRIDRLFYIGRASEADAREIIRIHLARHRGAEEHLDELVEAAVRALFDPDKVLYEHRLSVPDGPDEERRLLLGHLACGALIENAIKQARHLARRRAQAEGQTSPLAIQVADIEAAFAEVYAAKQRVDIDTDVKTFLGDDSERLIGAKRFLRQVQR